MVVRATKYFHNIPGTNSIFILLITLTFLLMTVMPVRCLPQKTIEKPVPGSNRSKMGPPPPPMVTQNGDQDKKSFRVGFPDDSAVQTHTDKDTIVFPDSSVHSTTDRSMQSPDGPIFRGNAPRKSPFVPDPAMIEACSKYGGTFCSSISNYPKTLVNEALKTKLLRNEGLANDSLPAVVQTRFESSVDMSLCDSTEQIVFPEAGETKTDRTWKFIVQSENTDMKQGVRVEICKNQNQSCTFGEMDSIPNGYSTSCVQKYIYRKLAAIQEDGRVSYDQFKLPSCCECMYRVINVATRQSQLGRGAPKANT